MSASMSEETWIEILLAFDALKMEEKHVSIKKKFARALKGNGAYEYIDNACVVYVYSIQSCILNVYCVYVVYM